MIQGSAEWFAARCGKVTASRLNDVLATIKSGEAASRRNYRMQLVVETLTSSPAESYTNGAMQWGIDHEADARSCYEFTTGNTVTEVGFIDHPTIPGFGASPDGMIGDDGLLEIKCPNTANHVDWMLAGVVPSEHVNQIMGQLACTGRQWCDFVSYDPRMPVDLQFFTARIHWDETRIATITEAVTTMRSEVDALVARLRELQK